MEHHLSGHEKYLGANCSLVRRITSHYQQTGFKDNYVWIWNQTTGYLLTLRIEGIASPIMMTSSNGNIFRVTGPDTGEFPAQKPVTRSFDVFFDLRLIKRLSKHSRGWWFETLSRPLWWHCNDNTFRCSTNSRRTNGRPPIMSFMNALSDQRAFSVLVMLFKIAYYIETRNIENLWYWNIRYPIFHVFSCPSVKIFRRARQYHFHACAIIESDRATDKYIISIWS